MFLQGRRIDKMPFFRPSDNVMDFSRYDVFSLLLRIALGCPGASAGAFPQLSAEEWERIYNEADRQTWHEGCK